MVLPTIGLRTAKEQNWCSRVRSVVVLLLNLGGGAAAGGVMTYIDRR